MLVALGLIQRADQFVVGLLAQEEVKSQAFLF